MSGLTPASYLSKVQKLKYKVAIFPILLVFISFIINMTFGIDQVKYLSVIGLVWYIIIIMKFRVKKAYPHKKENKILLSPIHGKIIKIEENSISIKRGIFDPADLRYSGQEMEVDLSSNNIKYFEEEPEVPGKLIGIILSSGICKCSVPNDWEIVVRSGEKVSAGETILAEKLT